MLPKGSFDSGANTCESDPHQNRCRLLANLCTFTAIIVRDRNLSGRVGGDGARGWGLCDSASRDV
eukprot:1145288-Pelagomonas_calceolata.AAC.1